MHFQQVSCVEQTTKFLCKFKAGDDEFYLVSRENKVLNTIKKRRTLLIKWFETFLLLALPLFTEVLSRVCPDKTI